MARKNYFNTGDVYSEWHRKEDGIFMIDVDHVETDKKTKRPLMLAENARNFGDAKEKDFRTTQLMAIELNVPGLLVLYDSSVPKELIREKIRCEEDIRLRKDHFERTTGRDFDTLETIDMFHIKRIDPKVDVNFKEVTPQQYYAYLHSLHK